MAQQQSPLRSEVDFTARHQLRPDSLAEIGGRRQPDPSSSDAPSVGNNSLACSSTQGGGGRAGARAVSFSGQEGICSELADQHSTIETSFGGPLAASYQQRRWCGRASLMASKEALCLPNVTSHRCGCAQGHDTDLSQQAPTFIHQLQATANKLLPQSRSSSC